MVEIREGQFKDFFETPFDIYGPNSPFVSVFRDDLKRFLDHKNPLFAHFGEFTYFTAYRDGKRVGRIVAHIHHASNKRHNERRGYFGYFDIANDPEVAQKLLAAAEEFSKKRGCNEIAGNFNLTAMQQIGVVTEGFENPPYTDQVWSPSYLPSLLEKNGYERFFPMVTGEVDLTKFDAETLLNDRIKASMQNCEFKTVNKNNFKQLMHDTCDVLNDGFINNPMFVPLTHEEFWFQAKDMMLVVDERLPQIAYINGKVVGSLVCIPDLNPFLKAVRSRLGLKVPWEFYKFKKNRDRALIIFYSVSREVHGQGINGALLYRAVSAMQKAGYKKLGLTWIADSNKASLRQTEKMGAKQMHRLHLFKKSLTP